MRWIQPSKVNLTIFVILYPSLTPFPRVSLTANGRESTLIGKKQLRGKPQEDSPEFASISVHSRLKKEWPGATGLAEDVRYYGAWMREEAQKRIGHLYPPVEITAEMAKERPDLKSLVGQKLTVIAWIWARTVKSPNPAFSHVDVPLESTFILSSKEGRKAYVQPTVAGETYKFTVKLCTPTSEAERGTKADGRGANFRCLVSDTPIDGNYIKAEGKAGRMGARLLGVVAEGPTGRVYLSPTHETEEIAGSVPNGA